MHGVLASLDYDDGRDDDDDEKTKKWRKEPLGNRNDVKKKHQKLAERTDEQTKD